MKNRSSLTNAQRKAIGFKPKDNGEIAHAAEKIAHSRKNDNVRPDSI